MDKPPQEFSIIVLKQGFLNLWINQIIVQLCYNALNFTLLLWIFRLTHSTTAVSGLMVAVYLPGMVFGNFAGIFVDLFDRRRIISLIDLSMAVCFVGLWFMKDFYWAILLLTFLINALGIFYLSSEASAIPLIVEKSKLLMANSLFSVTLFLTFMVGFGLSGPLIANWGVSSIFAIGATLLLIGAGAASLMPRIVGELDENARELKDALQKASLPRIYHLVVAEIKRNFQRVHANKKVLAAILIISGEQSIVGILGVLIPSFFETVLKINATDSSVVLILPLGLGMIAGGVLISRIGYKLHKFQMIGSGIGIAGLLLALLGLGPLINPITHRLARIRPFFARPSHSTMIILGAFLLGMALVAVIVPAQTLIQEETHESARGKIFSFLTTVAAALSLLPVLVIGSLADILGSASIFVLLGVILQPICWYTLSHLAALRE